MLRQRLPGIEAPVRPAVSRSRGRLGPLVVAAALAHVALLALAVAAIDPRPVEDDAPPPVEMVFAVAPPTPEPQEAAAEPVPAMPSPDQPTEPPPIAPMPEPPPPEPPPPEPSQPATPPDVAPAPPPPEPPSSAPTPEPAKPVPRESPVRTPVRPPVAAAPIRPPQPRPARPTPPPVQGPPALVSPTPPGPASAAAPVMRSEVPVAPAPTAAAVSGTWRSALASWLQSHKQYPDEARRQREEGQVTIRFTVGRDGQLTEAQIVRGSGSDILDRAALATLRDGRAPPFPADMPQQQVTTTVTIRYRLED